MKKKTAPSLKNAEIMLLSFFGVGFSPFAPGTMGSLAAIPFIYILTIYRVPWVLLIPFIIISTVISSFLSEHAQKKFSTHDPQWIVIDEVLGMLVCWLFYPYGNLLDIFFLFIIFRFFDIFKIWPASYFDKKVKHGAGIIIDDLISGIYAGLSYRILKNIAEYFNFI